MIPHIVEDDIFTEQELKEINYYYVKEFNKNERVYSRVDVKHPLYDILLKAAENKFYQHRLKLRDEVKNKRCLHSDEPDECFWNISVASHKPNYTHKLHKDSGYKLLSTVFFFSERGEGTIFKGHNGNKVLYNKEHQIEWKRNRAMSFIPSKTSWHYFKNTLDTNRETIVFFYGNNISGKNL